MTHHIVDSQTLRQAVTFLERTWVGVGDQDRLLNAISAMRAALATPLNSDGSAPVIISRQSVS